MSNLVTLKNYVSTKKGKCFYVSTTKIFMCKRSLKISSGSPKSSPMLHCTRGFGLLDQVATEGVIIEWPLTGLFHVIITSPMVVIRFQSKDGHYLKYWNFVVIIGESNNLEMTVSENHDKKS